MATMCRMMVLWNPMCKEKWEEGNSQDTGGSTRVKRVDTASSMVGGVARIWLGLMSFTKWSVKTGLAYRLL
jgi:hypothetical protein